MSKFARIINGVEAETDSWFGLVFLKLQTRIQYFSGGSFGKCGGAVVGKHSVLTAAHCCFGKYAALMYFKDKVSC